VTTWGFAAPETGRPFAPADRRRGRAGAGASAGAEARPPSRRRERPRAARSTALLRASGITICATTSPACSSPIAPTSRQSGPGYGTPAPRQPSTPTATSGPTATSRLRPP